MVRLDVGDLRADVHRQAAQQQQRLGGDALGDGHYFVVRHTELRRLLAGLGVGMRLGRYVRVHPDADPGLLADALRRGDHRFQLGRRFDVEEADARADRVVQLGGRLPDAGEDDGVGVEPRQQRPPQLAHRHDVRARPQLLEDAQHPDVPVGLDRVADAVADVLEGVVEGVVLSADQVGAVDVGGGTDALPDGAQQRGVKA